MNHHGNIIVVAYNAKLKAYVVRYASGPISSYMEGRSRETRLGEFLSHARALKFANEVSADAGGVDVHDLKTSRNRSGGRTTKPRPLGTDRDRFHGNPNARKNRNKSGQRARYGERASCKTCKMDIEFHGSKTGWIGRGSDRFCDESGSAVPNLPHKLHKPYR